MLKSALKSALYRTGGLPALHRMRNRRALTVIMLHRVLGKSDRRFAYCDPEYTMEAEVFESCLDFFQAHYNVVGVESLFGDAADLPDRPLLITFDDGWADHEQVAMPILKKRGLPSLTFIAADAVDCTGPTPFWEMGLIHGFRRGVLDGAALAELWRAAGGPPPPPSNDLRGWRALIARLFALDPERLPALLAPFQDRLKVPERDLLTQAELARLPGSGMAIGGHGARHRPLGRIADAPADIRRSATLLGERLAAPVSTMSFPHGSYDPTAVGAARDAGFRLIFTSDKVLNPLPARGPLPQMLGRVGLFEDQIVDGSGRLQPELLALGLWRQPHALLTDRPRVYQT